MRNSIAHNNEIVESGIANQGISKINWKIEFGDMIQSTKFSKTWINQQNFNWQKICSPTCHPILILSNCENRAKPSRSYDSEPPTWQVSAAMLMSTIQFRTDNWHWKLSGSFVQGIVCDRWITELIRMFPALLLDLVSDICDASCAAALWHGLASSMVFATIHVHRFTTGLISRKPS